MSLKHLLLAASIFLNMVLVWALVWGGQGLVSYRALRYELDALSERAETLSEKNIQLSREIRLLGSDERHIERMIRKRLNFVKENEIWYIFPGQSVTEGANESEN